MLRTVLSVAALAAAQLAAAAPSPSQQAPAQSIKPGLWQINSKMSSPDAETSQLMSTLLTQFGSLPPEQRAMVEQMANKNGMAMPKVGADGAIGVSACVTPEMAARRQIPTGQPGDCTSNNVAVPGGWQISFRCNNPVSSGEGKLSFVGDTGFTMNLQVNTSARGAQERINVASSGSWIAATCPAGAR